MGSQQWNPQLYDNNHKFVSEYGSDLLELLKPKKDELILDLGCGTGDLAKKINDLGANVICIDSSKEMIEKARQKYPELDFKLMDALNIKLDKQVDGIFSNAVLHWIKEPKKVMKSAIKVLKPKGKLVVEFGGKGNIKTITDCLIENIKSLGYDYNMENFPWYFPSIGEYASLLEEVGFEVSYATLFDRLTKLEGKDGLTNWIKMFGSKLFIGISSDDKEVIINKLNEQLKSKLYIDNHWYADYKRIRVVAYKK